MTREEINYSAAGEFEQLYIRLREKEGRMYKDEEVALLPFIQHTHPKFEEWKIRAKSFKKLLRYLKQFQSPVSILEVGCGNGWFSSRLAASIQGTVTGIDVNLTELQQAKRVFQQQSNLEFMEGDIRDGILKEKKFNVILFAASIQYFSPLKETLDVALSLLTETGEIHLMDSHFYMQDELMAARQRTKDYYESLGFPQLSNHYYHHSMESLRPYNFTVLGDPYSWKNKFASTKNPFYWIVIKK